MSGSNGSEDYDIEILDQQDEDLIIAALGHDLDQRGRYCVRCRRSWQRILTEQENCDG